LGLLVLIAPQTQGCALGFHRTAPSGLTQEMSQRTDSQRTQNRNGIKRIGIATDKLNNPGLGVQGSLTFSTVASALPD
jgi:hypothetical protein